MEMGAHTYFRLLRGQQPHFVFDLGKVCSHDKPFSFLSALLSLILHICNTFMHLKKTKVLLQGPEKGSSTFQLLIPFPREKNYEIFVLRGARLPL